MTIVKEHKLNKVNQNDCFDDLLTKVTSEDAMLVIDYKENIELMVGPEEVLFICFNC